MKRTLFSRAPRSRPRSATDDSLNYQSLEPRQMLAGVYLDTSTATLTIFGDAGDNVAQTTINGTNLRITFYDVGTYDYPLISFNNLVFLGFAGNDELSNYTSIPARMLGHGGDDILRGGSKRDIMNGGPGDDFVVGNDGNDKILGVSGNDWLEGKAGNDEIFGSLTGTNLINGGDGHDLIFGGNQDDEIHAGDGLDQVFALAGDDSIFSGPGGTAGGNGDLVLGNSGNDTITGHSGLDILRGGSGDDILLGGQGQNRLIGEGGHDQLTGGPVADFLSGGNQNDILDGQGGNDYILAGPGNDSVYGGGGIDQIFGESGNDGLFGGVGAIETMVGGSGADRFLVTPGDSIADLTSSDAQVNFVNASSGWTDLEIQTIDRGLFELHQRTGSTRVLKDTLDPDPLSFYNEQAGTFGNNRSGRNTLSWNGTVDPRNGNILTEKYTRKIQIEDWNLSDPVETEWASLVVIHEISHNWDSVFEINRGLGGSGSLWNSFTAQTPWSNSNRSGYTYAGTTREPFDRVWNAARQNFDVLTKSWWYSNNGDFARNYGKADAKEDWATTWESIFVPNLVSVPNQGHAVVVQAKKNVVDALFGAL